MSKETSSGPTGAFGQGHPPPVTDDEADRVIRIDEAAAGAVFDALGSETARAILAALHEEPRTASELAAAIDSSIQNVRYHLEKFQEAALVEIVDRRQSQRGHKMKVYAPTDREILLYSGAEDRTEESLRGTLRRLLGAVGGLALLSLIVDRVVRRLAEPAARVDPQSAPATGTDPAVVDVLGVGVPPGAFVFLGGLLVLVALGLSHHAG
ncbi:MAG: ArsR/SmtB family transcription factor [Halanaeroarchaeum sp.]